jgi:hypothetical protein
MLQDTNLLRHKPMCDEQVLILEDDSANINICKTNNSKSENI